MCFKDIILLFFIKYIISGIIWFLVAYLFHFTLIGWFIGLIISFLFEEFIAPKLFINSVNQILKTNKTIFSDNTNSNNLSLLLNNFTIEKDDYYSSTIYRHKLKSFFANPDFQFEVSVYKKSFDNSEIRIKIIYNATNRNRIKDIILNKKNLLSLNNHVIVNFFRNNNWNAESIFYIPIKSNYKDYFKLSDDEIVLIFGNYKETILVNEDLRKVLNESIDLCYSLDND